MNNKLFLISFLFLLTFKAFCQVDTEFWFVAPDIDAKHGDRPIYFNLTTQGQPAQVKISQPANSSFVPIETTIPANTTERIRIYDRENMDHLENIFGGSPFSKRGILIKSTALITAYYEVSAGQNPDIYSLKGKNALGSEFYTPFQQLMPNADGYNSFQIIATEDNTQVTINPTLDLIKGCTPVYQAGQDHTITLNRGEVFLGTAAKDGETCSTPGNKPDQHPSGTYIKTNGKKVAVIVHDDSVQPKGYSCKDLMGDQLIPTSLLGNEYIAMRGAMHVKSDTLEKLIILSMDDNNSLEINGSSETVLAKGQTYLYTLQDEYTHIKADSNIYVLQMSGYGCEYGEAILPATNKCNGSPEVSFTTSDPNGLYFNILVTKGAEDAFFINGSPAPFIQSSDFSAVPGDNNWMAARIGPIDTAYVPVGKATTISNSKGLFHLGLINGRLKSGGTRFGYFSNFNEFDVDAINTSNGEDRYRACYDEEVTLIAAGGTSDESSESIHYQWSNGSTNPSITLNPSTDQWYYVTATLSGACNITAVDSTFIGVQPKINGSLTDGDTICQGDSIELTASGSDYYIWSNGDSGSTIEASPDTSSMIAVKITDTIGCYDEDSTWIEVLPSPQIAIDSISHGCQGKELTLDPELPANFDYQWNTGAKTPTLTINTADTYSLTATSTNGCSSSRETEVILHPEPSPSIPNDTVICPGTTVKLKASGGASYKWSNGSEDSTIKVTPTSDSNYQITVSDQYGCTTSRSIDVQIHPEAQADAGADQEICQGDTATLIASGGISYLWSNMSTNDTNRLIPSFSRDYAVTVTDTNGCRDSDIVYVQLKSPPSLNLNPSDTINACQNTMLTINSSLSSNIEHQWSTGDTANSIKTLQEGRIYLEVSNSAGCQSKDSIYIKRQPAPVANINPDTSVCEGSNIKIWTPFNQHYQYKWNEDVNTNAFQASIDTHRFFALTVTDHYGCTSYDSSTIYANPNPPPKTIEGPEKTYINENNVLYNVKKTPGNNYTWSILNNRGTTFSNDTFAYVDWGSTTGPATLVYTETNPSTNCQTAMSKTINLVRPPQIYLNKTNVTCHGEDNGLLHVFIADSGIPPLHYEWSHTSENKPMLTDISPGTYAITVTDAEGKTAIDTDTINEPPPLIISNVATTNPLCHSKATGEIKLEVEGGTPSYSYSWSGTNAETNNPVNLKADKYTVTIHDANHCTTDTSIRITSPPAIIIQPNIEHPLCPRSNDGSISLNIKGGTPYNKEPQYQYEWSTGAISDSLDNLDDGIYHLTISDSNTCQAYDTIELKPQKEICFDIPNAFTPNNDGVNDTWSMPQLNDYYPNARIEVFNRWGNLVFYSKGKYKAWDGTSGGEKLPIDSYHYIIDLHDDGRFINGTVTILR